MSTTVVQMQGVALQPFVSRDFGFESRQGHGYLSLMSVIFFQVEVSLTGLSSSRGVLSSVVFQCVLKTTTIRRPTLTRSC